MEESPKEKLAKIVDQMRRIQKSISATDQPPSMFQIDELSRLGREYAQLLEELKSASGSLQNPTTG